MLPGSIDRRRVGKVAPFKVLDVSCRSKHVSSHSLARSIASWVFNDEYNVGSCGDTSGIK